MINFFRVATQTCQPPTAKKAKMVPENCTIFIHPTAREKPLMLHSEPLHWKLLNNTNVVAQSLLLQNVFFYDKQRLIGRHTVLVQHLNTWPVTKCDWSFYFFASWHISMWPYKTSFLAIRAWLFPMTQLQLSCFLPLHWLLHQSCRCEGKCVWPKPPRQQNANEGKQTHRFSQETSLQSSTSGVEKSRTYSFWDKKVASFQVDWIWNMQWWSDLAEQQLR